MITDSTPGKVVIVTSIHPDFDKRVWRHARGLADLGYKVNVICPWSVESGSVVEGVTLVTFAIRKAWLNRLTRIPMRILGLLRQPELQSGIVHFHDFDLLPWMSVLSLFRTVVYDVHENYPEEVRNRPWVPRPLQGLAGFLVKWGQWICARIIRNIVLVTPYQESGFPGSGFNKVYVKNYASMNLLDSVRDDYAERDRIVAFVGAQHANNGSFLMLEIAALCKARGIDCRFIAPDYFPKAEVRQRYLQGCEEYSLADIVELFPPVRPQEIMTILNRCRVAINPNLRVEQQIKGIHTKMFEFMAAGVPVIASDLPHQLALIMETGCGYALPPEKPETFVNAIATLLDDSQLAAEMGKRGREAFVRTYSWESQIRLLDAFYRELRK